jgi:hypothetical protein
VSNTDRHDHGDPDPARWKRRSNPHCSGEFVRRIRQFVLLGNDDTIIAALTLSNQVVLIDPDGQQQAVLTAADGLSYPTAVAVWYGTLYVCNEAYFTKIDPNLLSARLERRR